MVVDDVVITDPVCGLEGVNHVIRACEQVGVNVHVEAGFFDASLSRPYVQSLRGRGLLTFSAGPYDPVRLGLKRTLDVVASFSLLVYFAPVLLLILLGAKLTSRGPALYGQERVGLNGRRFRLYKFRSMRVGAEAHRDELAAVNVMDGPVFKAVRDPRVTRFGRFLRQYCLDELPQLWNVLKGDMSLVGPRPPLPSEVPAYERWQRRRLSMRPGITGLWQVSGRHALSFAEWMAADLRYIDGWSLGQDFSILARTIPVVLSGKGL
jgi:exopolysaccharide biosynthesis polyprenyl glycosylphosphotransferase